MHQVLLFHAPNKLQLPRYRHLTHLPPCWSQKPVEPGKDAGFHARCGSAGPDAVRL